MNDKSKYCAEEKVKIKQAFESSEKDDKTERDITNTEPKIPVTTQLILTKESPTKEPSLCLDFSKPLSKDVMKILSISQASSQIKDEDANEVIVV